MIGVRPAPNGRSRAEIRFDRRTTHLGTFDTPDEAAKVYDVAALEAYGPGAETNFDLADRDPLIEPIRGELDALESLNAVLGDSHFWKPDTLDHVGPEALQAFIDRAGGSWPRQRKGWRDYVTAARELAARGVAGDRDAMAWERMQWCRGVLDEERFLEDWRTLRALAYAAGLPLELVLGQRDEEDVYAHQTASYRGAYGPICTWLPGGLEVPGRLHLDGSEISTPPKRLRVGGTLMLDSVKTLKALPEDLEVGLDLAIRDTPIQELPRHIRVGREILIKGTGLLMLDDQAIREACENPNLKIRRT